MPTYEYICENCKDHFEHFQSIKDEPLKKCKKCGKSDLKRLIGSGAGIIFKGSGFYQTDYRSESYKKAERAEKSSTGSSTTETKTQKKEKPVAAKNEKKKA
jgi:putative FmdB family regulatory protein